MLLLVLSVNGFSGHRSTVYGASAAPTTRDDTTARDLRLGKGLYDQGMFERALAPLERVRTGDATRGEKEEALFLLGEAYRSLERLSDAEGRFGELLRLAPRSEWAPLARLGRGEALVRLDRAREAIPLLELVATTAPSGEGSDDHRAEDHRPVAAYWLGEAHARLGAIDRAIAAWSRVTREFPEHALAPFAAYNGALRERDRDRAAAGLALLDTLPAATRASLSADLADRWHLLAGELALAAGDPERARTEYVAVRGEATRPAALAGAAWAAHAAGEFGALARLRDELARDFPRSAERVEIDILLGSVRAEEGDAETARRLLAPHRDGPRADEATFWTAWAHRRAGESERAAELFASIAGEGEWALRATLRAEEEFRKAERWEDALDAARRFIGSWRDDARAPVIVAGAIESSYRLGEDARVLELAESFATQWPDDPRAAAVAHYAAEAALRSEDPARAVTFFARVWDAGGEPDADVSRTAVAARYAWALSKTDAPDAPRRIAGLLGAVDGPVAAEVGVILGRAWSERGKTEAAVAAYRAAAAADPGGEHGARARLEIGTMLAKRDDPAARAVAEEAYREALAADGDPAVRARARIDLATLLAEEGRDDEAETEFERYVDEFDDGPDRADAWLGLAFCRWRGGDADEAREALSALERETRRGGDDAATRIRRSEARYLAGRIAAANGETEAAGRAYTAALELEPDGPRAPELLRELARVAEERDRPAEAIGYLTQRIDRFPNAPGADECLYRLAWIRLAEGGDDPAPAAAAFRKLLEEHPESSFAADAHFRLGEIAYAADDFASARVAYAAALEREAEPAIAERARYRIGWGYRKQEEWGKAEEAFAALAAAHPEGDLAGEALYLAADAADRAGKSDAARAYLESFLEGFAQHERAPAVKIRLAEALSAGGRGGAKGDATPTGRANAFERERWSRIRSLLDPLRVVQLEEPWHTRHRIALGRALVRLGEGERAVPILTEALDEGGARAAEAQFEIGLAHRVAGDRERAVEAFIHGPVLYPYQPWAVRSHLEAGRDLLASGKRREAERVLKLAIEHDPDGEIAKEARAMLEGRPTNGSDGKEAF